MKSQWFFLGCMTGCGVLGVVMFCMEDNSLMKCEVDRDAARATVVKQAANLKEAAQVATQALSVSERAVHTLEILYPNVGRK